MRKELKKRNITSLDVVYSEEEPIKILEDYKGNENIKENEGAKKIKKIGSIAFVPSIAGLLISYKVIRELLK